MYSSVGSHISLSKVLYSNYVKNHHFRQTTNQNAQTALLPLQSFAIIPALLRPSTSSSPNDICFTVQSVDRTLMTCLEKNEHE